MTPKVTLATLQSNLWRAISPDQLLAPFETDCRWLPQVNLSVQPTMGKGAVLWYSPGAELLDAVLNTKDPEHKAKELQIKIAGRLCKQMDDPRYCELSACLEYLKEQHEGGQLHSIAFLKPLLDPGFDSINAEKEVPQQEAGDCDKAALTELFQQVRRSDAPIIVERIVAEIDDIARKVRFPEWKAINVDEREVREALRRTLFKGKLGTDTELFEKAYGYVTKYFSEETQ
jgi:type I restriction enzyme R subunit